MSTKGSSAPNSSLTSRGINNPTTLTATAPSSGGSSAAGSIIPPNSPTGKNRYNKNIPSTRKSFLAATFRSMSPTTPNPSDDGGTLLPLASAPRSESMAYPPTQPLFSKASYFMRVHSKAIIASLAFLSFIYIMTSSSDSSGGRPLQSFMTTGGTFDYWGGATHPGYFTVESSKIDDLTYRFAAVTDLDQLSRVEESSKPLFKSILLPGTIHRNPETDEYTINFEETRTLLSKHNEAGRGMELSELTIYQNRLLSFDDRTGDVFELLNKNGGTETYVVPRFVITEGEGDTDKGMKWEWSTVKNNELYMGSMGKEFTNPDGSVANTNNLWVSVLNKYGELRRIDWTPMFNFVRAALGASSPGYMINEAVLWSDHLNKWVFLPRRISSTAYDEDVDEKRGSNKLVLVDEAFTSATIVEIAMADLDPLHGFSSFAFVPGTKDRHAMAIRSVEEDCTGPLEKCKQRSYFMVFEVLTGKVLCDEVQYPLNLKFEGLEFVDINTPEPNYT
mmetsp:Transcript_21101/g.29806  ORF Transcript_21101/g.29806 Transcript_21101/m.29806 type:complete len:504 (-) Transcript_21101:241-1752(-)